MKRFARRLLVVIGGSVVVVSALLTAGTFWPRVPVVGTLGSLLLPTTVTSFMVNAAVGSVLAGGAAFLGARKTGAAFAIVGLLAAVGDAVVLTDQLQVASSNGVEVSVAESLIPPPAATPDETVVYTTDRDAELTMDIYLPPGPTDGSTPVVMYTHGGGWIGGSPSDGAAKLRWFADRGYLAVAPNYTLATPDHPTWDTAAPQIVCAMTWVAENAATYGGDAGKFFMYGESSGGALTLTAAYGSGDGRVQSSCGGNVPDVRAVAVEVPAVDPYSFYDNSDLLLGTTAKDMVSQYLGGLPSEQSARADAVSSSTYIDADVPRTLIVTSDDDHLVPVEGAAEFISLAQGEGIDLTVVDRRWADHPIATVYPSVASQTLLGLIDKFFADPER